MITNGNELFEYAERRLQSIGNKGDAVAWHLGEYDGEILIYLLVGSDFTLFAFPTGELSSDDTNELSEFDELITLASSIPTMQFTGRAKVVHTALCEMIWNACDIDTELIAIRDDLDRGNGNEVY